MRADRLVQLVLLLRQRGRMTADSLAEALEVSTRTVLRDIEALSTSGVPVYAERGRHGGFSLLPGFRTELSGLNHEETLALLTASGRGDEVFGLSRALTSAMRKVVDALPEPHRATVDDASRRFLLEPETDLLSRRRAGREVPREVLDVVRRAVLTGHRLAITYGTTERVVDPLGLVTVRERTYLLALRDGQDRTYRLSRVTGAVELDEPARRPSDVDLERLWRERSARFLAEDHLDVTVLVLPTHREELLTTAVAVRAEEPDVDGRLRLELSFQDARHAVWALWRLGEAVEVLAPESLRRSLYERATILTQRYR